MTNDIPDTESTHPAPRIDPRQSGLRLVHSVAANGYPSDMAIDAPAVPCLTLRSAVEEKSQVMLSILMSLFQSLKTGERIEFVHWVSKGRSLNGVPLPSYKLTIKVACHPEKLAAMRKLVAEIILTAYPGLHFESWKEVSDETCDSASLPHVAQFAPAGAVVAAIPTTGKPGKPLWRASGDFCSNTHRERSKGNALPFPGKLANWALTAPLYEPMDLPDVLEVNVRIHGFSLNDKSSEALHKMLMRVLSGSLHVFHPDSPIAAYSASPDLKESAVSLLRQWLRHPSGYAADCVFRSSSPLGEVAQRRISADVFGDRPIQKVSSFDGVTPQRLEQPTLAWAILPEQGIPALMPGQFNLHTLGIPRHYAAPSVTPPNIGARLGTTVCGSRSGIVALPATSRSRHVALFGSSGSGKSSLLTQMISEDIADPNRSCGVGLIDPHGDLYQRIVEMIPTERAKDVILVDTCDIARTACVNPLEGMEDPIHAQFVVSEIMSLIDMLFESKDTSGPMTRSVLRNLLLLTACMSERNGTILDAVRILENSDYRDYLLSKCRDKNVIEFWDNFKRTRSSENGYAEWIPYLLARLIPMTANPIMKRLICRPDSTIDLARVMRNKKIVLFNLSKSVLQDSECQVLGSLILMKFFAAALSRAKLPIDQRAPFHLYVDEYQTFATDSSPRMFSEARKFGLCLTTANQSLSQLSNRWGRSSITESILANTATKFLFRLGPADAETLRPYFRPQFEDAAMATLPDFHAVACMSDQNRPLPPFVFKANLASPNPELHMPTAELVALSSKRYTAPVERANQELMKLYDLSAESLGMKEQDAVDKEMVEERPSHYLQSGHLALSA